MQNFEVFQVMEVFIEKDQKLQTYYQLEE